MAVGSKKIYLAITLGFAVFTGYSMLHHEMWLDELQAWLLVTDTTLSELFALLHYEAHPAGWHLILKCAAWIKNVPETMQVVHWLIAVVTVFLFVSYSPFSRVEKILFVFGYYQSYEYCVISRNYGLGWLALCLVLIFHQKQRIFLRTFFLCILAHTNIFGWIIALAFMLAHVAEIILARVRQTELAFGSREFIGHCILGAALALSLYSMYPAGDFGMPLFAKHQSRFDFVLASITWGFNPSLDHTIWFAPYHWYHNLAPGFKTLFFAVALCSWIYFVLKKHLRSALFFSIATTGILLFFYLFYMGFVRHHGMIFLVFIAGLWMKRADGRGNKLPETGFAQLIFYVILSLQFLQGLAAHVEDIERPFSQARETARYLRQPEFKDAMIVAEPDYRATAISGYLGQKLYSVKLDKWQSYMTWNTQSPQDVELPVLVNKAKILSAKHRVILLIAGKQRADTIVNSGIPLVSSFTGGILPDEDFYLFEIKGIPRP